MQTPQQIALAGFTPLERSLIESCLRMAVRRGVHYELTPDLTRAVLVIGNADDAAVVRALRARPAGKKVLLVGQSDGGTGWPLLQRRVCLTELVGAVAEQLGERGSAAKVLLDRAFAKTEPFVPLLERPAAPDRPAETEPPAQTASARMRFAFAATQPFAPLAVEPPTPAAPVFAATEPFVPLQAESAPARLNAPAAFAQTEPISLELLLGLKHAAQPGPKKLRASTDFMGLAGVPEPVPQADGSGGQVLLVDDSEVALRFMQKQFALLGISVKLARSGAEALQLIGRERFSHVFLDVMLSGMDGFRTCRALKTYPYPEGQAPKVVLVTGLGGSADKSRGKLAGCDDYLIKPVTPERLANAMGLELA